MKLFRISNILLLCVAACFGALLFRTSQSVQGAEDRLAELRQGIRQEKETIRVLGAEWDYLNRPQRLEELADKYLKVEAPQAAHFVENAGSIPEPAISEVPTGASAILTQPVAMQTAPAPAKPVPSEYIKASEKQSFETLIKNLEAGE